MWLLLNKSLPPLPAAQGQVPHARARKAGGGGAQEEGDWSQGCL
jgi:hypothetical protein